MENEVCSVRPRNMSSSEDEADEADARFNALLQDVDTLIHESPSKPAPPPLPARGPRPDGGASAAAEAALAMAAASAEADEAIPSRVVPAENLRKLRRSLVGIPVWC